MIALLLFACSAPASSTSALTNAGYTEIEITGWSPLSCGFDWANEPGGYSTGFKAKAANGQAASGVVCCGTFKACTIPF